MWVEDNLNEKIPLDGPQWRIHGQMYTNEEGVTGMLMLWKCHHSFMDGVSSMASVASGTVNFGRDLFVKFTDVPAYKQWFLRLSSPIYFLMLTAGTVFTTRDKNALTLGKKKMTGKLNLASSDILSVPKIKALSKKLGITINDIVLSATSTAMKEYLTMRGDKDLKTI